MKQATNFRLSTKATSALQLLEKKMHTSKTAVVEMAILELAKKTLAQQNNLLAFAGILKAKEADDMLDVIKSHKHNKKIKDEL
jgi:hypothetical protein